MKPSELAALDDLPDIVTAYRAGDAGLSYTLSLAIAEVFASRKNCGISRYSVRKDQIIALILRRGEAEVVVLDELQPEATF